MTAPTLYVAVSFHGFGHVAQTAPVVNALRRLRPDLRLVVQSAAPETLLRSRFEGPFDHVARASDFGMKMASSLEVLAGPSHDAYAALHADWDRAVAEEWQRIAPWEPGLLLANVPYLSLAAAHRGGVPAVALASLTWAHTYPAYCRALPGAAGIGAEMLAAYASARLVLAPEPAMAMPGLANLRPIGPIARLGRSRRAALCEHLGIAGDARLVLVFLGGVRTALGVADWPRPEGLHWLVPADQCPVDPRAHPRVHAIEATGLPYADLLASVDALVTKPGYGSFAEAACHALPTLYVRRPGWPEEPFLVEWLQRRAQCLELDRAAFERGEFAPALQRLWRLPPRAPVAATGAEEAAAVLAGMLAG